MPWTKTLPTNTPENLRDLIQDRDSMTKRLQSMFSSFEVKVLKDQWLESIGEQRTKLREVYLICDGKPFLYGRTLIPEPMIKAIPALGDLGTTPLGKVLFSNPEIKRGEMMFAEIDEDDSLYQQALQGIKERPATLFARRSVFSFEDNQLTLFEVFLH